ncbi:MAG TPA: formyltransferase family protein [Burkholderiales bacterium]|nr:formyltransferase family protein [Burkholderiales bacterium]
MTQLRAPRIVVCGKGWLACNALSYLYDLRQATLLRRDLAAVPVHGDTGRDSWEPSLRAVCTQLTVRTFDSVADVRLQAVDLLFSLQYDRIIRLAELNGARAFNLHFSALPDYRGCYPSMWPIRNGETQVGVSLHVLTAGIDDGDIVDQQRYDLPRFTSALDLYARHHAHGYEVFKRSLPAILAQQERPRPQSPGQSRYFDRGSIDFQQTELGNHRLRSSRDCVGFLKSFIFPPFQLPTVHGRRVIDAESVTWPIDLEQLAAMPDIVSETPASALLACRDGLIRVRFETPAQGSNRI